MIPLGYFLAISLYELLTMPLYLRIIYVLGSNKELSSPFFRFLLIIGCCECVAFVANVAFYRLPMVEFSYQWFDVSPNRLYSIGPFLLYFCNYPVYFLQVAISLNRLTSVWAPLRHGRFWKRIWIPTAIVAFAISFGLCFHRSPFNAVTTLTPIIKDHPESGRVTTLSYDSYLTWIDINLITAIFNTIVVLLSLAINTGTLVKILQMKRAGNLSESSTLQLEISLFIIVVWMFCSLIIATIYQVIQFLNHNYWTGALQDNVRLWLFLYQPLVFDICSVCHPWVLIAMSWQIRGAALPFLERYRQAVMKAFTFSSCPPQNTTTIGPMRNTLVK